jgi:hypothetical protein
VERLVQVVDRHVMNNMLATGQLKGLNPEIQAGGDNNQIAQNNYAAAIATDPSRTI